MKKTLFLIVAVMAMIIVSCGSDKPSLTSAAIMAQDIIKSEFAADCDFEDMDIRGEETSPGSFTVYQRFTTSKYPGDEFVYKIYMEYLGGDWTDASSWSHSGLIIENRITGAQWYGTQTPTPATTKTTSETTRETSFERTYDETNAIFAGGDTLKIFTGSDKYARVFTEEPLSNKTLQQIGKELKNKKERRIIYFHEYGDFARGSEYATYEDGTLFDFRIKDTKKAILKL